MKTDNIPDSKEAAAKNASADKPAADTVNKIAAQAAKTAEADAKKKKPTRKKRMKKDITDPNTPMARLLLIPSLAGVLLFYIVPSFIVAFYSIVDNPISKQFVGIQNFKNLFGSFAFTTAGKNTMLLSFTAVPAAVILSLMLANVLNSKIPGKSMLRTFFLSPMMVPVASVVLIWQVMFHHTGSVNAMLTWLQKSHIGTFIHCIDDTVTTMFGGTPHPLTDWGSIDWLKSDKSMIVIVLLFLWKNLGYNMILFLSALNNIPKDLIEVADLEGASPMWRMVHIKFRYLSPTFMFVTIMSLINSFKLFREVYLLTGDYPHENLFMLQHFMNNTFRTLDYQKLSSAALVMAAVMVLIIGVLFTIESIFGRDVEG